MMSIELRPLILGDSIWRAIKGSCFSHFGVIVGFSKDGYPLVLENQKNIGTQVVTLETFSKSQKIILEKRSLTDTNSFQQRVHESLLRNKPYNILSWNCEHLKNFVLSGESESGQLHGAMAIFLLAAIICVSD